MNGTPTPFQPEMNPQFARALRLMEHSYLNLFITGKAGTGKSTLLEHFQRHSGKKVAVLAPTGVAALNVKGQTIHSFFGFKPGVTPENLPELRSGRRSALYKKLDAIVIDEVSMVRADLLDCVDGFLRRYGGRPDLPFGGVQMIFIGDLYQLPPVVSREEMAAFTGCYETPYFYGSRAFRDLPLSMIELTKIYRQQDPEFIRLLNGLRDNSIDQAGLNRLNRRVEPDFEPTDDDFYICLTTTNLAARQINQLRLDKLEGPIFTFSASISGTFSREYLPTAIELEIKSGAQVMLLNNDLAGRWVNGSVGRIVSIQAEEHPAAILVELSNGKIVRVTPNTWEIFRYYLEEGRLLSELVGSFTQYPLTLAWAVTIHKSQGKTFEKVMIDMGRGAFAHGQTYVALSRCTSLEGIILKQPLFKHHIWTDESIRAFMASLGTEETDDTEEEKPATL
jgi:ATP-dependent exoDNAse (exonuclease V) alpha subunit